MERGTYHIYIRCLFVLALITLLTACAENDPLASLPQGETGRVVRIIDGDALVLDTGLTVRLVGLEAPVPERYNRTGQPFADQSKRMLEDMAMGRQVRLIYPGITRDRYDRALAFVKTEDRLGPVLWLNQEMLRNGGARARFYPDTSALGELLLSEELEARGNNRGLWAMTEYEIVAASELPVDARGFHIVSGTLAGIGVPNEEDTELQCVRSIRDATLKLGIEPAVSSLCTSSNTGETYVVRGYIYEGKMDITHMLNAQNIPQNNERAGAAKAP